MIAKKASFWYYRQNRVRKLAMSPLILVSPPMPTALPGEFAPEDILEICRLRDEDRENNPFATISKNFTELLPAQMINELLLLKLVFEEFVKLPVLFACVIIRTNMDLYRDNRYLEYLQNELADPNNGVIIYNGVNAHVLQEYISRITQIEKFIVEAQQ